MIGKHVQEISIGNMNWNQALPIIQSLVENEYAVMVTLEEELIIIDYECASDIDCRQSNRNYVTFMSNDEFEEHEDEIIAKATSEHEEFYDGEGVE